MCSFLTDLISPIATAQWWSLFIPPLIATFFGVLLAFYFEHKRTEKKEKEIFQSGVLALTYESSVFLVSLKGIRLNIGPQSMTAVRLSPTTAEFILKDHIFHKYSGEGLIQLTASVHQQCCTLNHTFDIVQRAFEKTGKIDKANQALLDRDMEVCEFYLVKLQEFLDVYLKKYKVKRKVEGSFASMKQDISKFKDYIAKKYP